MPSRLVLSSDWPDSKPAHGHLSFQALPTQRVTRVVTF